MENIDFDLYSRQIFTYGKDIMEKIINLKILIIGLRGLGIEIAKNLVLIGPKEISISDKNICEIKDLGANFYISMNDVNKKTREDACIEKLSMLNKYVDLTIYNGNYKEDICKFNIIIITEIMKDKDLFEINEICRKNNIGFIYTLSFGLTGYIFNDFGENFIVNDINGEKNLNYHVFNIEEKGDKYLIYLDLKKNENFDLKEGEYIILKEVKGLEFLNDNIPKKIENVNKNSFEIQNNYKSKKKYICGGIIEEVKIPKKMKFNSLKIDLYVPNNNFVTLDKGKKKSNILLHCSFVGLHHYFNLYDKLPELNNLEDVSQVIEFSYKYYLEIKEKYTEYLYIKRKKELIEFDEIFIKNAIRWAKSEINPICNFLGGIVSQEAIKITGKYLPIYQWLRFDFFETIKDIPENCNRNLLNTRYDDQIAIFGQENHEKLKKLNLFMIGAGALGCEYLKNFALMGISQDENHITVTDNDAIIISNLNRQFLFNEKDIGKNKSFCACREAKKINSDINLISQNYLVSKENIDIYNDLFWEKQDLIISAVDNISARKYIDDQCTFYNKIFIDAGTEGTKANSDIYIPDKTICLNDLNFNSEEKIPMCTLKNFPSKIEHCIQYSKIIFDELFVLYIKELKMCAENENKFFNILIGVMNNDELYLKLEILKYLYYILDNPSNLLIVKFSMFIFEFYFSFNIEKLLKEQKDAFIDILNKKPSPLNINLEDETNLSYFKYFFLILAELMNFEQKINIDEIKLFIKQIEIRIEVKEREILLADFELEVMNKIKENKNNIKEKINRLKSIVFEKDNDQNNQINFILSFSNLRAKNYNIGQSNFLKAKKIAGNIIPAIASTTSAITGLSCIQIYNLIQTNNIRLFRSGAFNLATSEFDLFIPEEKHYTKNNPKTKTNPEYKVIPKEFTIWDKIDIKGPNLTIKSLVNEFKDKYNVDIDFINYNDKILASPMNKDTNFNKTIEKLIEEKTGKKINKETKYIKLDLNSSIGDVEILTPTIRYILNNNN